MWRGRLAGGRIEMKIDPRIPAPESSGTSRIADARTGPAKNSSSSVASEPTDTVQLSAGQTAIRALVSDLSQVPDVRQQQVSALRSEVQSGRFVRSSAVAAGAIVDQQFSPNL